MLQSALNHAQTHKAAEIIELCQNHYWSWQVREQTNDPELFLELCRISAKVDVDAYMIYLEHKRPLLNQFYMPRRRAFKSVIEDLQDLNDRVIEHYGLSLPAGTGKSTIALFFLTMQFGIYPDAPNLATAYSDDICESFYLECFNILSDTDTYAWQDLFPEYKVIDGGIKKKVIDVIPAGDSIDKRRYHTLLAASVGASLTGRARVGENGFLYADDLVKGIEEALSIDQLNKKMSMFQNMALDRTKDGYRSLLIGTRWNLFDPIGQMREIYKDDPRYRFREIPALNDNNESNFDYSPSPDGFSTKYYLDMRNALDPADWAAKYQQKPYMREGALFDADKMLYYDKLPEGKYRKYYICDIAWGGGDYYTGGIFYVTEDDDIYVEDIIFSKEAKEITQPQTVRLIEKHLPEQCWWEAKHDGTESYPEKIAEMLKKLGIHTHVGKLTGKAPDGSKKKKARLVQWSGDINKMHFKKEGNRHPEYVAFLHNLFSISALGDAKHDDSGDMLAFAAQKILEKSKYEPNKVTIRKRFI